VTGSAYNCVVRAVRVCLGRLYRASRYLWLSSLHRCSLPAPPLYGPCLFLMSTHVYATTVVMTTALRCTRSVTCLKQLHTVSCACWEVTEVKLRQLCWCSQHTQHSHAAAARPVSQSAGQHQPYMPARYRTCNYHLAADSSNITPPSHSSVSSSTGPRPAAALQFSGRTLTPHPPYGLSVDRQTL
jgi:hypothetical protein